MNNYKFILLQINDALFPIGGYSHSYGLETYIQKDLICNKEDAKKYITQNLLYNLCYNDFLTIKLVYEYIQDNQTEETDITFQQISALHELMTACKTPFEVRDASFKLGSRFVKTVSNMDLSWNFPYFQSYAQEKKKHYALAYALFCASLSIPYEEALSSFMYAQVSMAVTNCVKSIPLSQSDGQAILYETHTCFYDVLEKMKTLAIEDYALSTPGFDIRCMQHEGLYSRIYMS